MSQRSLTPTAPTCAALERLLPLAAPNLPGDLLDEAQTATVRDHLASCAHCQRELALHVRADDALRQAFAVRAEAAPPFTREQLAALIADDAPPVRLATIGPRAARRLRPRLPLLAGLPAAAAVLLVALFAGYLFHLGGRGVTGVPTATPALHLPAGAQLTGIAPVSASEWWAAGAIWNPAYAHSGGYVQVTPGTSYVDPIIVHYAGGRFSFAMLPTSLVGRAYGVELNSIAMASPTEGWAVGNTVLPNADGWISSVLLHYTDGTWTQANAPINGWLNAITMRTPSDGWIAGRDNSGNTLVFHFDGTAWTPVDAPALAQLYIRTIATPAPNDVWMVGYHTDNGPPAAIVHYDGTHWTIASGPNPSFTFSCISMTSPNEGWAIAGTPGIEYQGADSAANVPAVTYILRYRDDAWEQQASFSQPKGAPYFFLIDLAMRSASDGWAVGSQGTLMHYSGGKWRQVPSPTTRDLFAVIVVGASDGWAVGDGVILRLSGDRWTVAARSPNQ